MLAADTLTSSDTLLRQSSASVVRRHSDGYLIYNSHTDELHVIPPVGMYLISLCDGLNTVGTLISLLAPRSRSAPDASEDAVRAFLAALVHRGILEVER